MARGANPLIVFPLGRRKTSSLSHSPKTEKTPKTEKNKTITKILVLLFISLFLLYLIL
jgi:hypothetical protein